MITICIVLAKGHEELEAITLIDILRRANFQVIVAGVDGEIIEGSHHIKTHTDKNIANINANDIDMLLLPGGMPGTQILCTHSHTQALLKEMNSKNKWIGAICAAPMALDKANILKGKFTCYPGLESEIKSKNYVSSKVVIDKNILTSQGPATAMLFGLEIVKLLAGEDKYQQLKNNLLF